MKIKITSGIEDYEIIETGSVITFNDEKIKFHLDGNLKIILNFINDETTNISNIIYKEINNSELELIFTNFNNPFGSSNTEPLPVAILNNRKIYINFKIYAINSLSPKTIHYTWYSREETIE